MNTALDVVSPVGDFMRYFSPVLFVVLALVLAGGAAFFLVRLIKKSKKAAPAPEKTAEDDTNESESK